MKYRDYTEIYQLIIYIYRTNRDVKEQEIFFDECVIYLPELELGGKTLMFKAGDSRMVLLMLS